MNALPSPNNPKPPADNLWGVLTSPLVFAMSLVCTLVATVLGIGVSFLTQPNLVANLLAGQAQILPIVLFMAPAVVFGVLTVLLLAAMVGRAMSGGGAPGSQPARQSTSAHKRNSWYKRLARYIENHTLRV